MGPLAHPDDPEVAGAAGGRRPVAARDRPPTAAAGGCRSWRLRTTVLVGAWWATLARASRAIRWSAVPLGPSDVQGGRRDVRLDRRARLGGTRPRGRRGRPSRPAPDPCRARRCAAPRPSRGSDRGWPVRRSRHRRARAPPRRGRAAARAARRSRGACTAASVWPARSCSSRAIRRRSSATACSASASTGRFELVDELALAAAGPVPSDEGEQARATSRPPIRSRCRGRARCATNHGRRGADQQDGGGARRASRGTTALNSTIVHDEEERALEVAVMADRPARRGR